MAFVTQVTRFTTQPSLLSDEKEVVMTIFTAMYRQLITEQSIMQHFITLTFNYAKINHSELHLQRRQSTSNISHRFSSSLCFFHQLQRMFTVCSVLLHLTHLKK